MKHAVAETFTLDNFEGPIDFLFHLIQKNEIDIYEVPIHKITAQYLEKLTQLSLDIDTGAEFVGTAASLLWLKSKTLLPKHEQIDEPEDQEEDPRFEIIHHLLDYCRFKSAAKALSELEFQQSGFYPRGNESGEFKKNLGIEHLSLDDLASLFQQILVKSIGQKGQVHEEVWKVADKIIFIQELLNTKQKIEFMVLFCIEMSREELIVTFLALLEMMKMGALRVVKDPNLQKVLIIR